MSGVWKWFRRPTPTERLARWNLRADTLAAAAAMASDPRTDPYVAELESSLTRSETVIRMMDARYEGHLGLLVLTSERILFRDRRSSGPLALSVPLAAIIAIEGSTYRVSGTVRITTFDGGLTVDNILGNQGETLADDTREAMRAGPQPKRDPLEILAELRALRDAGAISAEEFDVRKKAIWREI
jgi:hypothetical protein